MVPAQALAEARLSPGVAPQCADVQDLPPWETLIRQKGYSHGKEEEKTFRDAMACVPRNDAKVRTKDTMEILATTVPFKASLARLGFDADLEREKDRHPKFDAFSRIMLAAGVKSRWALNFQQQLDWLSRALALKLCHP